MAFKTHSGSSFFSLDGVPFTVSEKWKPPKKVTLPIKFETGNPSEFLFLEYDSTIEETLLARFEAERENEKAAAASAVITDTISRNSNNERPADVGGCHASTDSVNSRSQIEFGTKDAGQQSESTDRNAAHLTSHSYEKNFHQKSRHSNAAYHMNGNILVPTIATSGECVLPGTRQVANNFDLTDFENVQDPFENLSLKVMNDFEELDKVFLASSKSQSELLSGRDNQLSACVNSEFLQHLANDSVAHQNGEVASSHDCSNASSTLLEHVDASNQMTASGWNATESYLLPAASYVASYVDSSKVTSSNVSCLPPSSHPIVGQNSSESKIPHSILAGNLASSVLSSKNNIQSTEINYTTNNCVNPQNLLASSSSKQTDLAGGYVPYGGVPVASMWPTSVPSAAWPTTASNFNNRPLPAVTKNHLAYNNFEPYNTTKSSLRSAKSNPDLSAVDNGPGNPFVPFGRHTPPIDTRKHLPDRPSATQLPTRSDRPSTSGSTVLAKDTGTTEGMNRFSHEDSLYSSLSNEAQRFIDFIEAMGFPKLQTIRAVQKLGIDEKLVLDHLCAFSKLTEKGFSTKDVEKSLFLFDGDLEKAKSYITSTMTFRAMGFEEDRISKALIECSLDEEKSLDWLTS